MRNYLDQNLSRSERHIGMSVRLSLIDVGRLTLSVGGTVSWVLNCVAAQKASCTEGHRQATWLHLFLLTVDVV